MKTEDCCELRFNLDERNFSHVLSAVTLSALAARTSSVQSPHTSCIWIGGRFVMRTNLTERSLFEGADRFLCSMRWVDGLGAAEQGTFTAGCEIGCNPFISLAQSGPETSPAKTFSGQVTPASVLQDQQGLLARPNSSNSWLGQMATGVRSWGYDCRVRSHAYDQGFSSDAEGSGKQDPVYPAVELLSIAALAFFADVRGWQPDARTIRYFVWNQSVSFDVVPYAVAHRMNGVEGRSYVASDRGAAYGKGAAYKFFPESEEDKGVLTRASRRT